MNKRILGKDLEVSSIGFGCMGMSHAYGTVSTRKEAEALIAEAIECGCTFLIRQRYMEQRKTRDNPCIYRRISAAAENRSSGFVLHSSY